MATWSLSLPGAQEQIFLENVEKDAEEDPRLRKQDRGFNKGGLIVMVGGLAWFFVPSSQISAMRRSHLRAIANSAAENGRSAITGAIIEVLGNRGADPFRARGPRQNPDSPSGGVSDGAGGRPSLRRTRDQPVGLRVIREYHGADGLVHLSELPGTRGPPRRCSEVGQGVRSIGINITGRRSASGYPMARVWRMISLGSRESKSSP